MDELASGVMRIDIREKILKKSVAPEIDRRTKGRSF
jgi:hypothetical protein